MRDDSSQNVRIRPIRLPDGLEYALQWGQDEEVAASEERSRSALPILLFIHFTLNGKRI